MFPAQAGTGWPGQVALGGNTLKPIEIEMPELSSDDEGATLATWLVSIGDRVEKGDVIAELETDKATVELEAPATGRITGFAVEEGAEGIMPGTVLGSLDPEASSMPAEPSLAPASTGGAAPAAFTRPSASPESASEGVERLRSTTPLARRAALAREVDLATLTGSGPGGRIVEEDVLVHADPSSEDRREIAVEASGDLEAFRLSAKRIQQVPHFSLRTRSSMDAVIEVRTRLNRELADAGRETEISITDFILRATALALRDVPGANVAFAGDEIHLLDRVDIAVAVATDGGLVAPVVHDVDRKGLAALASETSALAVIAREGKLRPEQLRDGTFMISDLGMYGVETVYPILNPPQLCILGVGGAEEQPVVRNGEIVIGRIASLSLVVDPRAFDEAVAAQLLAALRERLEEPLCMML